MSRYLTVTCSATKCKNEGRAQLHGTEARDLPAGWVIVSYSYEGSQMEFCSLACVELWATAMQKAHAKQREWMKKTVPEETLATEADLIPEGALL